jgi:hypothetical protein
VSPGHSEAVAASDRGIGAHLAEDSVAIHCRCRPLSKRRRGERQQRVDEDSYQLVHRSSYCTVRVTVVERTRLPLVPVTVMV